MGLIARVLSFARVDRNGAKVADVKFDSGGEVISTGEHFGAPGDDAAPLPEDTAIVVRVRRTGGHVVVGYVDTTNEGKAADGEHRLYARDSAGVPVAEVWLKGDGTILASNDSGSFELKPSGDIDANGVMIDPNGNITMTGDITTTGKIVAPEIEGASVKAGGVQVTGHVHISSALGAPSGPMIPPPGP